MPRLSFLDSVGFAVKGLATGLSSERNLKIQCMVAFIIIAISAFLPLPKAEFLIIVLVCFFVMVLELVNTCFEKIIDIISPGYHDGFGRIKDMMAGSVLLVALLSMIVGMYILYDPVLDFLTELIITLN